MSCAEVSERRNTRITTIIVASLGAIITGIVMFSLQIVALTLNNPHDSYDYVSHGIWGGVLTEISSVICLIAVIRRETPAMIIAGAVMAFYSSAACLISVVLSGLSVFYGSCNLSDNECDKWNDIEWVINGFSFCTLCFNIVLTVVMRLSLNTFEMKLNTLDRPLKISFSSIILWGVASIALQIAALCTNDYTVSLGLAGQGIWAGIFYVITGILGLVPNKTKTSNPSLPIVFSALSGLFSIYMVVDSGLTLSLDACDTLNYPCYHWRGIEWALLAFNVVAFTEAAFLLILMSIVIYQKDEPANTFDR